MNNSKFYDLINLAESANILSESKADEIRSLATAGGMTKAEIAKKVGANYSQVHSTIKKMGDAANISAGQRGRKVSTTTKTKVTKTPAVKKSPATKKAKTYTTGAVSNIHIPAIKGHIMDQLTVLDSSKEDDLVAASADYLPAEVHDTLKAATIRKTVEAAIDELIRDGEIVRHRDGTITFHGGYETEKDIEFEPYDFPEDLKDDDLSAELDDLDADLGGYDDNWDESASSKRFLTKFATIIEEGAERKDRALRAAIKKNRKKNGK